MKTKILLSLLISLMTLSASAYDFMIDSIGYTKYNGDKEVLVTAGSKRNGALTIPPDVVYLGKTYSVTGIGYAAFEANSRITSVTIPNSVKSISKRAFKSCYNLRQVIIPNSVHTIGESAFQHCNKLASIVIPSSVTLIGDYAFMECKGLKSLTISNNITSIGKKAFNKCSGLESIIVEPRKTENYQYDSRDNCNAIIYTATNALVVGCNNTVIPNSVTSIDAYAFQDCKDLTSITIPESVYSIGEAAFSGCSGLESIIVEPGNPNYDSRNNCNAIISTATNALITGSNNTVIPNSVTSIDAYAFQNYKGLNSITIPNSVTSIGNAAFYCCSGLTSLKIPNSVTSIDRYSFYCCTGLTSVAIGDGVTTIGQDAFYQCVNLTKLTLGSNVKSIDEYAFYQCGKLTSITCKANIPPKILYADKTTVFFQVPKNIPLYVPMRSEQAYRSAYGWQDFSNIVGIDVTPHTIHGDVNGDDKVDIGDINILINIILGFDSESNSDDLADVNDDGKVDVADMNAIINIILGL